MFNLSRIRKVAVHEEWKAPSDEQVPEDLKDEHNFHKILRKRLDQEAGPLGPGLDLLSNEATRFVIMMLDKSPDDVGSVSLKDVMGEYYYYLKRFDNAYLKEISDIVSELKRKPEHVKRIMESMSAGQQQVPGMGPAPAPQGPQQQPPQAAMDPGIDSIPLGMSASGTGRTVTGKLFLKGPGKNHVMSNTILGRILNGEVHLIRPTGETIALVIKDDEVVVPGSSAAAGLAVKLEEEFPNLLRGAISEFLRKNSLPDPDFMARNVVERFCKNGTLDLRPVSALIGGCSLAMLLYDDVPGIMEPPLVGELRRELGERMGPLVDSLKSALAMHGVDVVEAEIAMPEHTEVGRRQKEDRARHRDRHPTKDPSVLAEDRLAKSMDVASVVMTAADRSSAPGLRAMALDRLVEIIASYPEVYEKNRLSIEDMHYLSKSANNQELGPRLERLSKFMELFGADDGFLIRTYSESPESDRKLMARLVAKQDRQDVIDANPEMCLAGGEIDPEFLSKIDPTNYGALSFLAKLAKLRNEGKVRIHRALDLKIAEAVYMTRDKALISEALRSRSFLPYLALSILLEQGDEDDRRFAAGKLHDLPSGYHVGDVVKDLLAASLSKAMGDDPKVMRLARRVLGATPGEVARFAGKKAGLDFMRATRSDWRGEEVPEAAKLFSLPDDPLPLARSYWQLAESGDPEARAGLHRLMHLLAQELSAKEDEQLRYALRYVNEAMSRLGEESSFINALSLPEVAEAKLLPDGSVLRKKAGRYHVDDVSVCFSSKPEDSELIAVSEIAKARKHNV